MNGKILIVDDSPADTLFLKKLMRDSDFEFDSTSTIKEAEEYLKESLPSAIILDYMLPDGDSMDIIDKYHNALPIVLLTGMEDPEIGLSAVKRGAQDFLTKGFINKDLLSKSLQYSMERQTLKKRVNSIEKMASLGRMSSGIAHEMNTPIQYVGDNLYFLEKEFSSIMDKVAKIRVLTNSSEASEFKDSVSQLLADIDFDFLNSEIPDAVKQSLHGMEKISKLVKALKSYATNETTETKKLDPNNILSQVIDSLTSRYSDFLVVDFKPEQNLKNFIAEERNLRQIFENILENSIFELKKQYESSQKTGLIEVSTKQMDKSIEIRISDSGPGIPEDIIEHVFDPFFTTKSFAGSLGQGLAIVHRLVHEVFSGTIKAISPVNQGAEFIINIPNQQIK